MISDFFLSLGVLLFVTKIFGELAEKIGFSSIAGEVIAGILLGPSVLNLVVANDSIEVISMLALLLLFFIAGLSIAFEEILDVYKSIIIAIFSGSLSFFLSFLVSKLFGFDTLASLVIGIAMISTSIGVSVRTLTEIGEIYSKSAKTMISASFSDDILVILALSLLFAYVNINSISNFSLLKVFLIVIGFYVIILNLGVFISKKLTSFFASMKDEQALISMALVTMFIVSILAEKLNIIAVTGAFLAGMMLAKSEYAQSSIIPKAKVIGYGFLIPIFFAYIGLKVELSALSSGFFLLIAIFLAELIGKYLGGYLGAKFTGMENSDSIKIGAGLIPMGEYTLVTAILALTTGIIQIEIYSILVSIVLLTTFVTPRILKFVYA